MSEPPDDLRRCRKYVLFFDICSSTKILEDLLSTGNERQWRNLLIALKEFLVSEVEKQEFEIHAFLGDGWVILFDPEKLNSTRLMMFLRRLCDVYADKFENKIAGVLEAPISNPGLKFGIAVGRLVEIRMNGKTEYIGRAMNIAARLQDAIKQRDFAPAGKLLIAKRAYTDLGFTNEGKLVRRNLRNISRGDRYQARKIIVRK